MPPVPPGWDPSRFPARQMPGEPVTVRVGESDCPCECLALRICEKNAKPSSRLHHVLLNRMNRQSGESSSLTVGMPIALDQQQHEPVRRRQLSQRFGETIL